MVLPAAVYDLIRSLSVLSSFYRPSHYVPAESGNHASRGVTLQVGAAAAGDLGSQLH
jgi:hypothetical protein